MSQPPFIVVTCGPAREPVDQVRHISNHSTGGLGRELGNILSQHGLQVLCLRGSGATAPPPDTECEAFETNEDLMEKLRALPRPPSALLHAAALTDFAVDPAHPLPSKISGSQELILHLKPKPKVLASLRDLFPSALLVGWKFETEGPLSRVLALAGKQIETCRTDACVVNGPGYGAGFGFYNPDGQLHSLPDAATLAHFLADWLSQHLTP